MEGLAQLYAFDNFKLDGLRLLLERDGRPVPLPPKAVMLLALLAGNSGRLLTKDELLSALWPDSVVEESNLAQYVFLLRKALGQDRNSQRYIVTVPNRGYRFVAPVQCAQEGARIGIPVRVSQAPRVAVLPLQHLAPGLGDEYIGLGLADALITRLGYMPGVKVRPTSAIVRYAGRGQDVLNAGQDLGVDYVVTGTIQRSGDQLRVSVQVLRSSDGSVACARQFDASFTSLFAVEDSLSAQVLQFLAPNLTGTRTRRRGPQQSVESAAYDSYLKGRYFWNKRTEDGLTKAIRHFQDAIDRDPGHALAYAGLADCYNLLGYYAQYPPRETYPKARDAAAKALELDGDLGEAHASLALVAAEYEWDWAQAEQEYRIALDLNSSHAAAHSWYADLLMATGRREESFAEIRQAQDLDPISLIFNCDKGFLLFMARRYREAIEILRAAAEMEPGHWRSYRFLGWALTESGEYDAAAAALRTAYDLFDAHPGALADAGYAMARSGRQEEGRAILRELLERQNSRYVSPYDLAVLHTGLGDHGGALEWIERALDVRPWQMMFLNVDPRLDRLRSLPRFHEIVRRMDLPQPEAPQSGKLVGRSLRPPDPEAG